ncbi:hypothetical protein GLW05_06495 [Pontibacillus yanchengensis]|uniref:Helix-turn-helix domain-containing protein n=1 Tax=Pontibacillus yanchengensis TaxID=462910 RepID=A0A6I4ZSQ5_9BACI|nr:hypothetical protein [Pontibacillus yanchengensis]MYL33248.1 hypothetical protein [Pontibacillus yanchengensis]
MGNDNKFMKLRNDFATYSSGYYLEPKELYLYCLLNELQNINFKTITNIDVINEYSPIKFYASKSEAKKDISNQLMKLNSKQVINIQGNLSDYNSMLQIEFDSIENKFYPMTFKEFHSFESIYEFYIYFVVARMENIKGNFKFSIYQFAEVLNITNATARKYVDSCVRKGIIFRNEGDFIGKQSTRPLQDRNEYKITPFSYQDKSYQQLKSESTQLDQNNNTDEKAEKEVSHTINSSQESEDTSNIQKAIDSFNTYKSNGKNYFPELNDYYLYVKSKENFFTPKEKELVKVADNRMKHLPSYIVSQKLDYANERYNKEKQEEKYKNEREAERSLIKKMKQSGNICIHTEGEMRKLSSSERLRLKHEVYFIFYDTNEFPRLETFNVLLLLKGGEEYEYSEEVLEFLLKLLKKILKEHKFDYTYTGLNKEIELKRRDILQSYNENRSIDEFQEGDMVIETKNYSLSSRKRTNNKREHFLE